MTKKEFEKETYLTPEWGTRVVTVERHFLENSPTDPNYGGDGEPGENPGDENYGDF